MSILAENLHKSFAETAAVQGVDMKVEPGEIFGLIGPNGAGKTTTLRILSGLMRPDSGAAMICGADVVREPRRAKANLGFVTGTTGLYSRLTVSELLDYFARLNGVADADLRRRKKELEQALQIGHLMQRLCGKLSTGERQRVSLARATVHDPPVLILDEPTAGLDVLASRFVADFIRASAGRGRAVLFSTHYMTEADLLCERIGCMHRGRVVWTGPPAGLREELGAASLEEAFLGLIEGEGGGGGERDRDGDGERERDGDGDGDRDGDGERDRDRDGEREREEES